MQEIPIIDLFAGPGGLGEGFSAFSPASAEADRVFRIAVSAEMDPTAHATLRLRAFFRQFENPEDVPQKYYDYIAGRVTKEEFEADPALSEYWRKADEEALCLTLGDADHNEQLDQRLRVVLKNKKHWVLIGGPPCQAYSLVGRARNQGIADYRAENDHRHFLYKEYLRIIKDYHPSIFVMENVKGILSSKVNGEVVFHKILDDLMGPFEKKEGRKKSAPVGYRLFSLGTGRGLDRNSPDDTFDPRDFVIRSEEYGVPQRRHRVFILGVREDLDVQSPPLLGKFDGKVPTVQDVIGGMMRLRSGLSRKGNSDAPGDSHKEWVETVAAGGGHLAEELRSLKFQELFGSDYEKTAKEIERTSWKVRSENQELPRAETVDDDTYGADDFQNMPKHLAAWYADKRLVGISNHETRSHIPSDLQRYLFSAAWGKVTGRTAKSSDFPEGISPAHLNWSTGKFADRFRVQLRDQPATTITSHISKDGHYFIHYDPEQCRSLTVREAARIQTFPDNYFFEGPRTKQYAQVGNAVPPFLAQQISRIVWNILKPAI
jgi:DNA (cytosine-5)-methyltransferase 1